jgi:UDP-glucose 4-epimerase
MNILVTGANGFIGRYLCEALIGIDVKVTAVVRKQTNELKGVHLMVKELSGQTEWRGVLNDVDVIVHLAGRAHIMKEDVEDVNQAYAVVNVDATKHLAEQAALCGVKRFVFLSSIGVNGRISDVPFLEVDQPKPQEDYAISKKNAEKVLWDIVATTGLEVVVIRPPLVYGKGAKGNFEKLTKLCMSKVPIPFGAIYNKRSLIYVENLVDFILLCIKHPKAANETFLVSDDNDLSTSQLIKGILDEADNKSILIPVPEVVIKYFFILIGKKEVYTKMCGNLQVNITKAKTLINWTPPFSFKQGIRKTMRK